MIKETFPYNLFTKEKERKSKIHAGYIHTDIVAMKCPKCGGPLPPLGHGGRQTCPCGLVMTLYGNALHCEIGCDS